MSGPIDYSLQVREAAVNHLKGYAPLTALVSADSIHGEQPAANPKWPFLRYGFPITTPYEATCWSGSGVRVTWHAFSKGPFTDAINRIARAIVAGMYSLEVENLGVTENEWLQTQVVRDTPEASDYHAIVEFALTVVSSD